MKVSQILAVCCCSWFLLGGCGLPSTGYDRAQQELNAILSGLDGVHPKMLSHDGHGAAGIDSPDSLADVWLTVDAEPDLDDLDAVWNVRAGGASRVGIVNDRGGPRLEPRR
jgi:hypothetical protein